MEIILCIGTSVVIARIVRFIEHIKLSALIYYIVENEYTEPTKKEMERCIDIVVRKKVEKWFMK